jgi:hypothetical protein
MPQSLPLLTCLLALAAGACTAAPSPVVTGPAAQDGPTARAHDPLAPNATIGAGAGDLGLFIDRFEQDESDVGRFYYIRWNESRFQRLARLYEDWRGYLGEVPFDTLSQQGKIDYLLLRTKLTALQRGQEFARRQLAEMEPALPFRETIIGLEEPRWRMEQVDPRGAAEIVNGLPGVVKKVRSRIEAGRDLKPDEPIPDPSAADAPIRLSPVVARHPIGREALLQDLQTEFIPG